MVLIRFHRNLKKVLVAWYSPKKQKLNNYDVIESYAEDFTRLNYYEHRGTINRTSNKMVLILLTLLLIRTLLICISILAIIKMNLLVR